MTLNINMLTTDIIMITCAHMLITIPVTVSVFQTEKCSLCYNLTKSTPGFAADPNNCQKFYMCEPAGGPDKWNVFPMTCPNCTFWNQEKLTCVKVYNDPDDTGVCGHFEPVTGEPVPTHGKCCLVSCSCTKLS